MKNEIMNINQIAVSILPSTDETEDEYIDVPHDHPLEDESYEANTGALDLNTISAFSVPISEDDEWKISTSHSYDDEEDNEVIDLSMTDDSIMSSLARTFEDREMQRQAEGAYKKSESEYDVAQQMMKYFHFVYHAHHLYIFQYPAYEIWDKKKLIAKFKDVASAEVRKCPISFWKRVISQIETTSEIQVDLDAVKHPIDEVVFENGCYNVAELKFRDATPSEYITTHNHITYLKSAAHKGDVTKSFFEFASGGNTEIKNLMWATIGAVLAPTSKYKKFFFLYGPPNSGKSVFGNLCEQLVGINNCSHISLEQLGDKYSAARLYGKMLNTSLDTSATIFKNLGVLKKLTSGGSDYIETEGKYDGFYNIRPDHIKLMFASNAIPRISPKDDPESIRTRMLILPFLNSVPSERRNCNLLHDLMREKDYIIKKGLNAYADLIRDNFEFPKCSVADEILNEIFGAGDSLLAFIKSDYCSLNPNAFIEGKELYNIYIEFCDEYNISPLTCNSFVKNIKTYPAIGCKRKEYNGKYVRGLTGIGVKKRNDLIF